MLQSTLPAASIHPPPPNTRLTPNYIPHTWDFRVLSRSITSQINWIFWNARRKNLWKSAKWLVVVGIPSGLKSQRRDWSLKSRFRGTLKKASEKNNAFRILKLRFKGSIN
ncbi:hypothetical protein AVEN_162486-1 [Araneus ventricosus]|uniref:Uncharacterized protein n=1 Tax=Araneus ventricosus TaxID=182803 RepID=A0A4Y2SAP6_ARAVE|nr:hypothetical protein AVEN_162486-1 [Araneus ventricosus]